MRLHELLDQSSRQRLDQEGQNPEDDQSGKFDADQIDGSLQDIAQNVQDRNAQPDLPAGAEQEDPTLDNENVKPIDSALMGQIRNLPYATRYPFDEKSPLNPLKLAAMQIAELSGILDMVRFKMQMTTMRNQVGLDQDTDMQFYTDLQRFINTVIQFKKKNTKSQLAATRPSVSYQGR